MQTDNRKHFFPPFIDPRPPQPDDPPKKISRQYVGKWSLYTGNVRQSAGKYDTARNLESAVKYRQMASSCAHVLCHAWLAGQRWGAASVKKKESGGGECRGKKRKSSVAVWVKVQRRRGGGGAIGYRSSYTRAMCALYSFFFFSRG